MGRVQGVGFRVFVQGVAPIVCRRLAYYSDPVFAGRCGANPYRKA